MSVKKYSKHAKSREAPIVLTKSDGEVLTFDSQEEYENSEFRSDVRKAKRLSLAKKELDSESDD